MRKVTKLFNIHIKSIDETNRKVTFCFSDDSVDRMGEKVDQSSWDISSYKNNPIILWGHDPSQPENVIGQGVDLELDVAGKSYITAQFDDAATNPKADTIFRQLVKRTLRCVSAGFISHTIDTEEDVPVLKDNELLEVSVVAIPANRNAIALAYKSGELSRKDASWMLKSMREEADLLEKQLAADKPELKEKDMDALQKELAEVKDLIGKMADNVNALTDELTTVKSTVEQLATAKADEKPADDEKGADEAPEQPENQDDADDPAKGGEHDQPGAGEDDIDLDAELTPELEERLEQALTQAA